MAFCSVGFAAIKAGTPSSSTYYLLIYTYTYFVILPIQTYRYHKTQQKSNYQAEMISDEPFKT